jgi:hypothetical protein
MDDIPDLDSLKTHLRELKKRNLVQYLTPEDKRGAVVSHSLYEPATLEHLRRKAEGMGVSLSQEPFSKAPPAPPPPPPEWLARLDQLESRVESLEKELSALKTALGQ